MAEQKRVAIHGGADRTRRTRRTRMMNMARKLEGPIGCLTHDPKDFPEGAMPIP